VKREDIAAMGPLARKELLEDVATLVQTGEWGFGEAVRFLRAVVLRKSRQDFARLVGISPAALQKLEDRADANPTLHTLSSVLRPFGGAVGLVFPRMAPSPAPSADTEQRRAALETALAGTRRK
jgi:transcriptional regulator with XRE-family HTH domain